MVLSFKSLTSTKQLSRAETEMILNEATKMEAVLEKGGDEQLKGKILASLFYEPSTRTRLSFETAMLRLGGGVITADGIQFSSLYKGESIEDTMKIVEQYADIIAMRHPEQGSADKAAAASSVPFINAGDGPGQHPTQALLDLYTIKKECGKVENIHIAMVGDLKFGRTVHSLSFLLGLFPGVTFKFLAPKELAMPEKVTSFLDEKKLPYESINSLNEAMQCDVLYMTRIQQERFTDRSEYERLKNSYCLTADIAKSGKAIILHPLPRLQEIATDVDALPNAAYFRQAGNGVPMRMALLKLLLL
jgi:aspartate carbamoyltransferase catalytic subunit